MRWFRRRDDGAQKADDGAQRADDGAPKPADGGQKTDGAAIYELINRHARAGSWPELQSELEAIDPASLDEEDSIAWYQGRGLAAERQGKQAEALEAYQAGLRAHPESSLMAFLVGRMLEEKRDFEQAQPLLRSLKLDAGGTLVMAAVRYLYLWDDWEGAAQLLGQIFDAYFALGVADDHFLYTRDLPFFGRAFSARGAIAVLAGKPEEASKLLDQAENELKELDAEDSRVTLRANLGEPADLLRTLRGGGSSRGSSGYEKMRLAVWASSDDATLEAALARLDSVALRDGDFPWLNDARVLARARAQRRFGDEAAASASAESFFSRQRWLLEPEWAFDFGLLSEQQALKGTYQQWIEHPG